MKNIIVFFIKISFAIFLQVFISFFFIADFARAASPIPKIQSMVPWTSNKFYSKYADTREIFLHLCFNLITKEFTDWGGESGCNIKKTEVIDVVEQFIKNNQQYSYLIGVDIVFPDNTFRDRKMDGTFVNYGSALTLSADTPMHAYNLHDKKTQNLFVEAYKLMIKKFQQLPNIKGYQIGYNIYLENLVGTYGFSPEALEAFRSYWLSKGMSESKLDSETLSDVNNLVKTMDINKQLTWPLPVLTLGGQYNDERESRSKRFFYASFQKFRQKDLASFHQKLFQTVKDESPDAWVLMYNAQLYTLHALPSPVYGSKFIQLGELAMLPVIDSQALTVHSLGKDEGMSLHGYTINRCQSSCQVTHDGYGTCLSNHGYKCVCEPVENGCLDDWSINRTVAYLRRSRAHGIIHRVDESYVRSGYAVINDSDWAYNELKRAKDFEALDYMVFNNYSYPGEEPWDRKINENIQTELTELYVYYPVWMLGAVPQGNAQPNPYNPGRFDVEFITNLLESRGINFAPVSDDWTGINKKIVVPYYDLIKPLLQEIPGYDESKIIPINTLPIKYPSPVDNAYADEIINNIKTATQINVPISNNPLEKNDPNNGWEPYWVMHAGAIKNVIYNLADHEHSVKMNDGQNITLKPFEVKISDTTPPAAPTGITVQ